MFKIVGFLALGTVLSVNSEKYSDDYELMNDAEDAYEYYNYDYDYDYGYEINENYEERYAQDDETYDDNYDFSEFDAMYAAQEGYNDDDDIAYGDFAKIGQFPYTVYLRITKPGGSVGICSGSIVGPRTVLTAHHCLDNNPTKITIEAGIKKKGVGFKRQVRKMTKYVRPSQSNSLSGKDIGLIYVNKPFKFNKAVNKVMLCGSTSSKLCGNSILVNDKLLYASGFGLQGTSTTGRLKYATMHLKSDTACRNAGHSVSSHHLCTKGGSGNTCGGDSGGPLVLRRSKDGKLDIQVGANSWSKTKCTDKNGNWDVFFEVSYGKSWFNTIPSYYKSGVQWV